MRRKPYACGVSSLAVPLASVEQADDLGMGVESHTYMLAPVRVLDPLPGEHLEGQMTPHALTEGQRERQPCNCVYQANLFITTQVHRAQPNGGNQLFDDTASIVVGAAVEKVRHYPIKLWIGKVFPTDRVESSEDTSPWRVLLEGSKAVQGAASQAICCVDNDAAIELMSRLVNRCLHSRAGQGHHHYFWLGAQHVGDRTNRYLVIYMLPSKTCGVVAQ